MFKKIWLAVIALAFVGACVADTGSASTSNTESDVKIAATAVTVPIPLMPPRLVAWNSVGPMVVSTDPDNPNVGANAKEVQFQVTQVPIGATINQVSLRVKGDNSFGPNLLTGCFFALYEQVDDSVVSTDFSIATQPPVFSSQTITLRGTFVPRVMQSGHTLFVVFYAGNDHYGPGPCRVFAAEVTYTPAA